jgi:hypothetical protein
LLFFLGGLLCNSLGFVNLPEDLLGMSVQNSSRTGQSNLMLISVKEDRPYTVLKLFDLMAKGRLGGMNYFRSSCKVKFPSYRDKVA